MKEALRQIEEGLQHINNSALYSATDQDEHNFRIGLEMIKRALVSLRTLLEGDLGEDEKSLKDFFEREIGVLESALILKIGNAEARRGNLDGAKNLLAALSRLSAKAKVGEAEIAKAKREVLEEIRKHRGEHIHRWETMSGKQMSTTCKCVLLKFIDEQIAALKEAGK